MTKVLMFIALCLTLGFAQAQPRQDYSQERNVTPGGGHGYYGRRHWQVDRHGRRYYVEQSCRRTGEGVRICRTWRVYAPQR